LEDQYQLLEKKFVGGDCALWNIAMGSTLNKCFPYAATVVTGIELDTKLKMGFKIILVYDAFEDCTFESKNTLSKATFL
tara:strand:- start:138 stop:374 length:237 start_codon:yes stop_codon:yes gene_type:complete